MEPALFALMRAYMQAGRPNQAIATGIQFLGLEPSAPGACRIIVHMMIARCYILTGRKDGAKEELRTMRDWWWKRSRLALSQLKEVARSTMEKGDPNGDLAEILSQVEEERSSYVP
jgi:ATP/maltotriose-dependent transcriptional regulator MalT